MKIVNKLGKFIFESNKWLFIAVIFAIILFKTGIWFSPAINGTYRIAINPFENPFLRPDDHYLLWSWMTPFLIWAVGIKTQNSFFLFLLFFSITFSILFSYLIFSKLPDKLARISLMLFAVLPISATAYFWVGYDSITLTLLTLILLFPNYSFIVFLIGIILGMQHFEQAFFASGALLFAISISKKIGEKFDYSIQFCLSLLFGIILGKLLLMQLFKYYGIDINSGRLSYLTNYFPLLSTYFILHFHYCIFSVLGLGWLAAIKYAESGYKTIPFFIALFCLCLWLPFVGDETRVLAIITFPLIAVYWLLNADFLERITQKECAFIFLLWVIVPLAFVFFGQPRWSVFPYDVIFLCNKMFGWFSNYVPLDQKSLAAWPWTS